MALPSDFLQEVILRNPLAEVMGQYVPLRRAGSNLVCCCPFHSEKTPSCTVYPDHHFYCYGCGAGGDVISFIKRIENLDYLSAVEYLANRAGLPMPQQNPYEKRVDKKRFYEMNAEAARFWHENLFSPKGKEGLDYLTGRGLTPAVIKHFGLGFASDSFSDLTDHLQKKGYRPEEIKEAFLGGISSKTGKPFDYFRRRAMFPIIDVAGNVVAFSGRFVGEMGPNDKKYFNTNDTPVFKKSRNIFALNFAKNNPDKEIVLCEGNMDAVSLHAAGITNAAASLGTALTSDQCRLLARFTDRVALCYDSDQAGVRATKKAIRLLEEAGIRVRVITLPREGPDGRELKDPDDFVRAFGKGGFLKCLKEARGSREYLFADLLSRHEVETLDGKSAFLKDCAALLSDLRDPVERELYLKKAADVTGLSVEVVRQSADRTAKTERVEEERALINATISRQRGYGNAANPDKARFAARAAKEEAVLGILLVRPGDLTDPKIRAILDPEQFRCDFCKKALKAILDATENGEPFAFSMLNENFSAEEIGALEEMRRKREQVSNNSPAILKELFARLAEEAEKDQGKNAPFDREWFEKIKAQKVKKS